MVDTAAHFADTHRNTTIAEPAFMLMVNLCDLLLCVLILTWLNTGFNMVVKAAPGYFK